MSIYTPVFNEDRAFLTPIILKRLNEYKKLDLIQIGQYIKKLTQEAKGEMKEKLKSISFDFMSDYSDEIHEVVVDMIRHCLIEKARNGYELTKLGLAFAKKDLKELFKIFKKDYG